jgi:hypothetical protein
MREAIVKAIKVLKDPASSFDAKQMAEVTIMGLLDLIPQPQAPPMPFFPMNPGISPFLPSPPVIPQNPYTPAPNPYHPGWPQIICTSGLEGIGNDTTIHGNTQ